MRGDARFTPSARHLIELFCRVVRCELGVCGSVADLEPADGLGRHAAVDLVGAHVLDGGADVVVHRRRRRTARHRPARNRHHHHHHSPLSQSHHHHHHSSPLSQSHKLPATAVTTTTVLRVLSDILLASVSV